MFTYNLPPHTNHHYIVDKSLEYSICSICGDKKLRKTVGWDTRED